MSEFEHRFELPIEPESLSSIFLAQAEELTGLGCFEWDMRTNSVRWSDGLYRIYGLEPQEFVPTLEAFLERVLPEDREKVQTAIRNAIENQSTFQCLERIRHASGEVRDLESRGQIILSDDGEPIKLVGVCRDVTARVSSQRAQAWQIDGLKLLAESASTILVEKTSQEWTPLFRDICNHLGCDGFANFEFDGNVLKLETIHGFPPEVVDDLRQLELGEGMCGVCAADRSFLYAPEPELQKYPQGSGLRDLGFRMFVGVPLIVDDQLLGTLSFASRTRAHLEEPELDFVETVGQLVSAAVSQKYYELRIAKKEQHFRAIVDSTADSIVLFDLDGAILDVNRETCETLGYDRIELLGMAIHEIAVDLPQEFAAGLSSLSNFPRLVNGRHRRKDGSTFEVEIRTNIIDYEGGKAILAAVRDTSDRLKVERQKRRAEETNRLVLEHAKMVTWEADPESLDFQFLSGACRELLGFTYKQWTQPGFWKNAIHPDDLDGVLDKIKLAYRDGQRFECRMKHNAEDYIWVEAIVKSTVESGVVTSLRGVFSNINHRKSLETKLRHTQKMEAIGRLAGGVAHDFNNLLTVINTYAEIMGYPNQGEADRKESVDAIQDAVRRATGLTDQLLMFGRNTGNRKCALDINGVIEGSERLLRRLIGADIHFSTKLQKDLPGVLADASHLDQVIVNLAVNARDAMPNGGCLQFETSLCDVKDDFPDLTAGPYVELRVTDTGCGMSEDVRTKAFEPFFTTKPVGEGSGLGLSVVYGVVREAGGTVLVNSQPGEGTEFRILLPATTMGFVEPDQTVRSVPNEGCERILLVEDDPAVRRATSSALRTHGYDVVEAESGDEALRIVDELRGDFALLLTDLVMPNVGGIELADKVSRLFPKIRVLCVSGYSETSLLDNRESYHFLAKPFTVSGLLAKAREVLDHADHARQT